MGLGSGAKVLYHSAPLTQDEFFRLLKDRRDRNVTLNSNEDRRPPEIDIDANAVAFKWINMACWMRIQICKRAFNNGSQCEYNS